MQAVQVSIRFYVHLDDQIVQPTINVSCRLEMSSFAQGQGKQRIVRRRTCSTPHNKILKFDKDIAKKGHF